MSRKNSKKVVTFVIVGVASVGITASAVLVAGRMFSPKRKLINAIQNTYSSQSLAEGNLIEKYTGIQSLARAITESGGNVTANLKVVNPSSKDGVGVTFDYNTENYGSSSGTAELSSDGKSVLGLEYIADSTGGYLKVDGLTNGYLKLKDKSFMRTLDSSVLSEAMKNIQTPQSSTPGQRPQQNYGQGGFGLYDEEDGLGQYPQQEESEQLPGAYGQMPQQGGAAPSYGGYGQGNVQSAPQSGSGQLPGGFGQLAQLSQLPQSDDVVKMVEEVIKRADVKKDETEKVDIDGSEMVCEKYVVTLDEKKADKLLQNMNQTKPGQNNQQRPDKEGNRQEDAETDDFDMQFEGQSEGKSGTQGGQPGMPGMQQGSQPGLGNVLASGVDDDVTLTVYVKDNQVKSFDLELSAEDENGTDIKVTSTNYGLDAATSSMKWDIEIASDSSAGSEIEFDINQEKIENQLVFEASVKSTGDRALEASLNQIIGLDDKSISGDAEIKMGDSDITVDYNGEITGLKRGQKAKISIDKASVNKSGEKILEISGDAGASAGDAKVKTLPDGADILDAATASDTEVSEFVGISSGKFSEKAQEVMTALAKLRGSEGVQQTPYGNNQQDPYGSYGQQNPYSSYGYDQQNPYSSYGYGQQDPYSSYGYGQQNPYSSYGYGQQNPYSSYGYSQQNPYSGFGMGPGMMGPGMMGPGMGPGMQQNPYSSYDDNSYSYYYSYDEDDDDSYSGFSGKDDSSSGDYEDN